MLFQRSRLAFFSEKQLKLGKNDNSQEAVLNGTCRVLEFPVARNPLLRRNRGNSVMGRSWNGKEREGEPHKSFVFLLYFSYLGGGNEGSREKMTVERVGCCCCLFKSRRTLRQKERLGESLQCTKSNFPFSSLPKRLKDLRFYHYLYYSTF